MATNITFRKTDSADNKPAATTVKNAPLSSLEIDGNFKSIKDNLDEMIVGGVGKLVQRHDVVSLGGQSIFDLPFSYTPGMDALMVFINGILGVAGSRYEETSSTRITMTPALALGDKVTVMVNVSPINNLPYNPVDGRKDLFVAGTNYTKNATTSITLSSAPAKSGTVKVFFDGIYQNKDTYYIVGNTVYFGAVGSLVAIPSDTVEVQYEIPSQFIALDADDLLILSDSQSISQSSAASADTARIAAEAARDAINTTGKVFTSTEGTAAGIAATSNGQQFAVLSNDSKSWIVYRNNAGSAVAIGPGNYTKTYFDGIFLNGFAAERIGYIYAWLDSFGTLLAGIKLDGTFWSKGSDLTSSAMIASDALALGNAASTAASVITNGPTRSEYLHVFTDSANHILGGFLANGDLQIKGVNHSTTLSDLPTVISLSTPTSNIVFFGDSLTEGAGAPIGQDIVTQLKSLYNTNGDNRDVRGFGYGGQPISSILARQGSIPTQITFPIGVSGFPEIPASGSVSVNVTNNPLQYADISQSKSISGSISGIDGILTRAANTNNYTFSRTTPGNAIPVDSGVPFLPSTTMYQYWSTVCWIGTNNLASDSTSTIMSGIANYLSWQITLQKRRIVIMPAIDCLSGSIATLKTNYAALLTAVKSTYPYEYIDTRSLLQRYNDGSPNDLADIADNLPPRSLLAADRYHLNANGYGVIAAEIKRIFTLKGF